MLPTRGGDSSLPLHAVAHPTAADAGPTSFVFLMRAVTSLKTVESKVRPLVEAALADGGGLLRLAPCWVPRSFLQPGKRLKLPPTHPRWARIAAINFDSGSPLIPRSSYASK
jgi:hypothetical protein